MVRSQEFSPPFSYKRFQVKVYFALLFVMNTKRAKRIFYFLKHVSNLEEGPRSFHIRFLMQLWESLFFRHDGKWAGSQSVGIPVTNGCRHSGGARGWQFTCTPGVSAICSWLHQKEFLLRQPPSHLTEGLQQVVSPYSSQLALTQPSPSYTHSTSADLCPQLDCGSCHNILEPRNLGIWRPWHREQCFAGWRRKQHSRDSYLWW